MGKAYEYAEGAGRGSCDDGADLHLTSGGYIRKKSNIAYRRSGELSVLHFFEKIKNEF